MALLRYSPFTEADDMPGIRRFEDTLNRFLNEPSARPWTPPVDILESEDALVLRMDIPGIELNDIDIHLENNTLTIKGERKFDQPSNGRGYHRIERSYGSFARSFTLPETVDSEKVRADFKLGVLNVTLPKKELAKPRSIKVEISS